MTLSAVVGALYRQCDENGKCQCKRGVTGDKCDRCDINYYDFGQSGCRWVFYLSPSCDRQWDDTCHTKVLMWDM